MVFALFIPYRAPKLNRLLRSCVAVGLLAFVIYKVDWQELPGYLRRIDRTSLLVALAGYGLQFVLSGIKWSWALRVLRVELPSGLLVRIYCISHFIGQFLPSGVGGDAYRALRTMPLVTPRTRALSAIVLERVAGLVALMTIGAVAAWPLQDRFPIARTFLIALLCTAVVAALVILIIWRGGLKRLTTLLQRFSWSTALREDFRMLKQGGPALPMFLFMALFFQLVSVGIYYIMFAGVQPQLPQLSQIALIAALIGVAGVLPVSINGLGVVEGSFAGSAFALGMDPAQGLLIAILARLIVLPWTLFCGLLYFWEQPPSGKPSLPHGDL